MNNVSQAWEQALVAFMKDKFQITLRHILVGRRYLLTSTSNHQLMPPSQRFGLIQTTTP